VPDANGNIEIGDYIDTNGNKVTDFNLLLQTSKVDQERFKWLEYYKIKFKADAYTKVYGKLVVRTLAEFGPWSIQSRPRSSSLNVSILVEMD
jgi:outer membrane protein insertion porin family